jgi:hypothetical protein
MTSSTNNIAVSQLENKLPKRVAKKDTLYFKAFSQGTPCNMMYGYHRVLETKVNNPIIRRMSSYNDFNLQLPEVNSPFASPRDIKLGVRKSCIGDTFNYVVNETSVDRAIEYAVSSYLDEDDNDYSLICFKLLKSINLVNVNKLTQAHMNLIIEKFVGLNLKKSKQENYFNSINNYLGTLSTGKFFASPSFLNLIDKCILEESRLNLSSTSKNEQTKMRLLFLFRFIFGLDMTLKTQLYVLNTIKEWCLTEDYSRENKDFGFSVASDLKWPDIRLHNWVDLFLDKADKQIKESKNRIALLDSKNNRCSYNGLDQIFCFVCCQVDLYGIEYKAPKTNFFPDVGDEIVFLTDKYGKSEDDLDIIKCLFSFTNDSKKDKCEIIKHIEGGAPIPKEFNTFKNIVKKLLEKYNEELIKKQQIILKTIKNKMEFTNKTTLVTATSQPPAPIPPVAAPIPPVAAPIPPVAAPIPPVAAPLPVSRGPSTESYRGFNGPLSRGSSVESLRGFDSPLTRASSAQMPLKRGHSMESLRGFINSRSAAFGKATKKSKKKKVKKGKRSKRA